MILHFSFFIVSCLLSMMNFVLHHQYEIKKRHSPDFAVALRPQSEV